MSRAFTYTPNEAHLRAALLLNYKVASRKRVAVFLLFGLVMGVALAAIDGFHDIRSGLIVIGAMLAWTLVVLAALIVAVRLVWLPRYAKRVFAQQRDLQSPVKIEWTDTHFIASAETGTTRMAWADFYRWRRNESILLLYRSEALFNFVPLDSAEALVAADDMQRLMIAAGVSEKR
jgi:hypothetical protein